MQDAVVLASCLYDVEEATQKNIEAALADYRAQRIGHVTVQVNMSKMMGKAMFGQVRHPRTKKKKVFVSCTR